MILIKKFSLILLNLSLILILTSCFNQSKNDNPTPPPQQSSKIIKAQENYSHQKMKEQIKQLKENYKSLTVTSFGKSLAQNKLYLLKLGSGSKKIAVVGGVHGREAITSLLILKLLEDYLRNQNKKIAGYELETILNKVSFYFIPMLNPDGIAIANQGIESLNLKSKEFYLQANEGSNNFKRWKANGRGVDLNKQFPAHWEKVKSESKPHFAHYKGPKPESEAESKALANLTRREKFSAVIAFHNSGKVIYWYYNQQGESYKRDYNLAQKLSTAANYQLIPPEDSDQYAAGYKDWFIKEFKQPGFTIEIGKKDGSKPLPAAKLNQYWQETRTILLTLASNLD